LYIIIDVQTPTNRNQAVAVTYGFISFKEEKAFAPKKQEEEGRGGSSSQVYKQI